VIYLGHLVLLGQWNAGDYGRMSMQLELEDNKCAHEEVLGKFLRGRPRRKREGNTCMNVQVRDKYFKS
jgi:hypothetical protein